MSWRNELFRRYYLRSGTPNSANSYAHNLRKIDRYCGGLDEKIAEVGHDGIVAWAERQCEGPFEGYAANNARSALRKYVTFLMDLSPAQANALLTETCTGDDPPAPLFRYEQELQAAVRQQIASIEPGLEIIDGGSEKTVPAGRIDVLAQDPAGAIVIIELKAGLCPKGAIEQVLACTADIDLEHQGSRNCRAILIAGEFSDRMLSAARRVNDLKMMTYSVNLAFAEAS